MYCIVVYECIIVMLCGCWLTIKLNVFVGPGRRNLFQHHSRLLEDYSDDRTPIASSPPSTSEDDLAIPPIEAQHAKSHSVMT